MAYSGLLHFLKWDENDVPNLCYCFSPSITSVAVGIADGEEQQRKTYTLSLIPYKKESMHT